jgi:hypothetical protein
MRSNYERHAIGTRNARAERFKAAFRRELARIRANEASVMLILASNEHVGCSNEHRATSDASLPQCVVNVPHSDRDGISS